MEVDFGTGALLILLGAGTAYGVLSRWIFERLTDRRELRETVDRMLAHALELGLFLDEPLVVWKAQRDLWRFNARLLRVTARASFSIAALSVVVFAFAEGWFGHAPLRVGETAVVTVRAPETAALRVPDGIAVETPAVWIERSHETCWRVRATRPVRGQLIANRANGQQRAPIAAGSGFVFRNPFSPVSVGYPRATVSGASWVVWFSLASLSGAAVLPVRNQGSRAP